MSSSERPVGLTASVGWEAGVRRTVSASADDVWALLRERPDLWIGDAETKTTVEVPGDRIRMQWLPRDVTWPRPATLQIRLLPAGPRTTVAVHLEHLPDAAAREIQLDRWRRVLEAISTALGLGS